METIAQIDERRTNIVKQMLAIRSMRRGTINEQFLKVRQKGKDEPVLRGPYYVLSRREGRRTVSERLTSPAQLEQARREIAAYKLFLSLCREFETMTERLGILERQDPQPGEKKRRKSISRPTGKSGG